MKRDKALVPLSREHHQYLLLAQMLKKNAPKYKGLPGDLAGKVEHARRMIFGIKKHFLTEERIFDLLPIGFSTIVEELKGEHERFLHFFDCSLRTAVSEDTCDTFARQFEKHIRKEERVLFQRIQQECPDQLNAISTIVHGFD